VLLASNGQEALSCYKEKQSDIDLVMLDVVMPVMGGVDAAHAMCAINANVKVIFATGFDVKDELKKQLSNSGWPVLNKPYDVKKISHVLREVLSPGYQI